MAITKRYSTKELKKNKEKLNSGDNLFVYASKIKDKPLVMRVMPTHDNMNGALYQEVTQYWVQGKPYTCNSTFGGISFMDDEKNKIIEKLKADNDVERLAIVNNILEEDDYRKQKYKKTSQVWFNILDLDFEADDVLRGLWLDVDGEALTEEEAAYHRTGFVMSKKAADRAGKNDKDYAGYDIIDYCLEKGLLDLNTEGTDAIIPKGVELGKAEPINLAKVRESIKDGKVKVLITSPYVGAMIMEQLDSKICISADGEYNLGIDEQDGVNMSLKKEIKGKKTEYAAQISSQKMEMPSELYTEETIPDIVAIIKKGIKPESFQRQVVRALLLDEDAPSEESNTDKPKAGTKVPNRRAARRQAIASTTTTEASKDEEVDEDENNDLVANAIKGDA